MPGFLGELLTDILQRLAEFPRPAPRTWPEAKEWFGDLATLFGLPAAVYYFMRRGIRIASTVWGVLRFGWLIGRGRYLLRYQLAVLKDANEMLATRHGVASVAIQRAALVASNLLLLSILGVLIYVFVRPFTTAAIPGFLGVATGYLLTEMQTLSRLQSAATLVAANTSELSKDINIIRRCFGRSAALAKDLLPDEVTSAAVVQPPAKGASDLEKELASLRGALTKYHDAMRTALQGQDERLIAIARFLEEAAMKNAPSTAPSADAC